MLQGRLQISLPFGHLLTAFQAFEDALEARDTEDWTTDAEKNLPSGEDH